MCLLGFVAMSIPMLYCHHEWQILLRLGCFRADVCIMQRVQVVFDKRVFGVGGIIRGSSEAVRAPASCQAVAVHLPAMPTCAVASADTLLCQRPRCIRCRFVMTLSRHDVLRTGQLGQLRVYVTCA